MTVNLRVINSLRAYAEGVEKMGDITLDKSTAWGKIEKKIGIDKNRESNLIIVIWIS